MTISAAMIGLISGYGPAYRTPNTSYFSELLIDVNFVLSLVPIPFTTAMIASAIPAAIKPYSMAVAPDSSARNLRTVFMAATIGRKTESAVKAVSGPLVKS